MGEEKRDLKIYGAVKDLVEYLDSCKQAAFASESIRKVDIAEAMKLISRINICIPDDIRRAQSILDEATSIIDNAQTHAEDTIEQAQKSAKSAFERGKHEAEKIVREAENKRDRMLDEHEITQEAKRLRDEMIEQTEECCRALYERTKTNVGALLGEAETVLHECIKKVHSERDRVFVREEDTRFDSSGDDEEDDRYIAADTGADDEDGYDEVEADFDDEDETEPAEKRRDEKKDSFGRRIISGVGKVLFPDDSGYDDDYSDSDGSFDDDRSVD